MAWTGGFARFSGVPDFSVGSTASARLSARHSHTLHNAVSRTLSGGTQRISNAITNRAQAVASVTAAAAAGVSSDTKVPNALNPGEFSVLRQGADSCSPYSVSPSPIFNSPSHTQTEQVHADAAALAALLLVSGFNAQSQTSTPERKSGSAPWQSPQPSSHSSNHSISDGPIHMSPSHHHQQHSLPQEVLQLAHASTSPKLPAPNSVDPKGLDNRELDKLVASLGRNPQTWRRSLILYDWLKECGHVFDDRLCTTLIRVCADHGHVVSSLDVYDWMKAPKEAGGAGLTPTVYTYTAAMRAALSANMLDTAMQVWGDCEVARCRPDCRLCITYIEVCSKMGQAEKALTMYDEMRSSPPHAKMAPTVHAYTAAMRAATEGGRWQRALEIWQDMKRAGCMPTGHAYAAAISACAAANDGALARQLFEEMRGAGIKADVVSCTALITALASSSDPDSAEAAVLWMLNEGLRPNVRTYTALLNALCAAQRWERAVEMLALMQKPEWGGVQPNAYTYSALLKSLGEHGQWRLAETVFAQAEREVLGYSPNPRPLQFPNKPSMLHADLPSGDSNQSANWEFPAQLHGLDLSSQHQYANNAGLFSLFSVQPFTNAIAASYIHPWPTLSPLLPPPLPSVEAHPAVHNSTLPPGSVEPNHEPHSRNRIETRIINEVVCGALMLAYERAGRWQEAVSVLPRARRLGLTPNTVMYNTAISAVSKAGQVDLAESLFGEVVEPDLVTYETMIAAYGMAGSPRKAEIVYQTMLAAGFRPRDYAYCGLVAAHSAVHELKSALAVRSRVLADGGHMTVHVYNSMLAACERTDAMEEAMEVLKMIAHDGVEPNSVTHQLLASLRRRHAMLDSDLNNNMLEAAASAASAMFNSAVGVVSTLLRQSDRLRIAGFSTV